MKLSGKMRGTVCLLGLLVSVLVMFNPYLPGAQAQKLTKVDVGYLPVISFAPIFIAMDKGYYAEEGIEVNLLNFPSGGKMISALATGDLAVAAGSTSAALYNAIAEGLDIKIVADKGQNRPGYHFGSVVLIRKDLFDSGAVRSIKDFKGRKVAIHAQAINLHYYLAAMLENAGLTLNDLQVEYLGPPQIVSALAGKAIDAAVTAEPTGAQAEARNVAVKKSFSEEVPQLRNTQVAVIMYSGKFMRENKRLAEGWMKAYVKGIKYHNRYGVKSKEVAPIVAKYTKVAEKVIQDSIPFYLDNDGKVLVDDLERQQDWFFKMGFVKKKVPMSQAVDESFLGIK